MNIMMTSIKFHFKHDGTYNLPLTKRTLAGYDTSTQNRVNTRQMHNVQNTFPVIHFYTLSYERLHIYL